MAGNKNSKLVVAAGVGAGLALGGLAAYWAFSGEDSKASQGAAQDNTARASHHSHIRNPAAGIRPEWTTEQLVILEMMEILYNEAKKEQGGHLSAEFYSMQQDLVALRTQEKVDALKESKMEELARDFKDMKFSDYAKKTLDLAIQIAEIEEVEEDKIADAFEEPVFIKASKVYLLRNNPDPLLHDEIVGSKVRHNRHQKVVYEFNLNQVLGYINTKIDRRTEQGFEFVDKINFVNDFKLQLEAEVLSKFNARLPEVWAFCALEKLGEDAPAWASTLQKYSKMLKTFYQSQTLYHPGIKII